MGLPGSNFPGRDLIFGILLSTMMIPAMVTIIPNFLTVTWLGRIGPIKWINNWPALTVPFMGSVFNIFMLRQFFAQIPDELFDAARIDGSGHMRFLFQVVLPLSKGTLDGDPGPDLYRILELVGLALVGDQHAGLAPDLGRYDELCH